MKNELTDEVLKHLDKALGDALRSPIPVITIGPEAIIDLRLAISLARVTCLVKRDLAAAQAALEQEKNEARDVPLCADHAQAWFTARYFNPGDCWPCQSRERIEELEAKLKAAEDEIGRRDITNDELMEMSVGDLIRWKDKRRRKAALLTALKSEVGV